jgi:hypothetical protein
MHDLLYVAARTNDQKTGKPDLFVIAPILRRVANSVGEFVQ